MLNLVLLLNWSGSLNFHVLPLWSCRCQPLFVSRFCKVSFLTWAIIVDRVFIL